MNTDDLTAWAKDHKLVVGAGAVVIVLAALYARHRAKAGQSASSTASTTGATTTDTSGGQYLVPYDGTANYSGGYNYPGGTVTYDPGGLLGGIPGGGTVADPAPIANPGPTPAPTGSGGNTGATATPTPVTYPAGYGLHTVVAGDTTAGIAAKYGLTLTQLRAYNPQFNFGAPLTAGEIFRVRSVAPIPTEPAGKGLPGYTPSSTGSPSSIANTLIPRTGVITLPVMQPA